MEIQRKRMKNCEVLIVDNICSTSQVFIND